MPPGLCNPVSLLDVLAPSSFYKNNVAMKLIFLMRVQVVLWAYVKLHVSKTKFLHFVCEQVVYIALVGSFPFNSFLSGVLSCVGTAVLAGKCSRSKFAG